MIPHNKSIRQPELLLGYGYTGHEHLPWFGLINMNARLYDPATGRFLNPDPVVQLPDNTQSYNRYSYCLNNPLRYTDPTGLESWFTNDPQEIGLLLNEIKNGGIDWTTEMFVNYARNRYETSSGWSYNPYATFSMGSSGRLFYTYCSVVNGNFTVFGCFVGYGASRNVSDFETKESGTTWDTFNRHPVFSAATATATTSNIAFSWAKPLLKEWSRYDEGRKIPNNVYREISVPTPIGYIDTNAKVVKGLAKFSKVTGAVGTAATVFDVIATYTDGHRGVAVAKTAIAASEFVLTSFVPGGAFIALGMVALEYTYGDYLYQYIDPSYNTELK